LTLTTVPILLTPDLDQSPVTRQHAWVDEFFSQVGTAANSRMYFLALAGALMIPDICGALESADGEATGSRYTVWFDRHVAPLHAYAGPPVLDGRTCYQFRCSLLHQGTTQHPRSSYSRILFVEPGATTNVLHMNVVNDALNIDVHSFCIEMVQAALTWRQSVAGTEPYETNLVKFVTRYPNGLPPYIGGVPVIS